MNETQAFRILAIKSLAIVGFLVTIALLLWLGFQGAQRVPGVFSSLASLAESMRDYRPVTELTLATEKSVVNSGESFQISWTDMKHDGVYVVQYACTEGVTLTVRSADNNLVPMRCTETLTLPQEVHGLFLTVESDKMRLTDIPLTLTWEGADGTEKMSETRVTVANATIPVAVVEPEPEVVVVPPVVAEPAPKPTVPAPTPKPVTTLVYPQSNPNGFTDLAITTLGSGVFQNGVFTFTAKYDRDLKNAVRFDVKNIGTKTSGTWSFKTILPDGQVYESKEQIPLKPLEHVEFTLGFDLGTNDDLVKIVNTVVSKGDANVRNDSTTWSVVVQD
jgi:hypothetical protein